MFNMLDRDKNNYISTTDLLEMVTNHRKAKNEDQQYVSLYTPNVALAIELYEFKRGDRVDLEEFTNMVAEIPYLIFPVFRL